MRACPRCFASYENDVDFCGLDGTQLIETDQDLLIGCMLDRYEILEKLGKGAMGSVYKARHTSLGRDFALKVLAGSFAANEAGIARFNREAEALSKIRHTNIVSVIDFMRTPEGLNVLVMDYLPGRTLHAAIQTEAPFTPDRAAKIARQIAAGLGAAHAAGLVHRDVKPSNVLLVAEGQDEVVKLLDFGVVALDSQPDLSQRLTGEGRVVGTPTYMAPEQAREGKITHAADLYSLGIVLYEMLAGDPPFDTKTVAEMLVAHAIEKPKPLPPSQGLEAIAMKLLEKDPRERYPSGEAVVSAIDQLMQAWLLPPEKPRRKRWPFFAAAATIAAAALTSAFMLNREPPILETALEAPTPPTTAPVLTAIEEPAALETVVEERKTPRPRRPRSTTPAPAPDQPEPEPTKANLDKRLDTILMKLRGASREIPPNLAKEVDDDYLALRVSLADARTQADYAAIQKRVRRLERKLDSLRKGERVADR